MSSESSPSDEQSDATDTWTHVEKLETAFPETEPYGGRVPMVRTHVTEYEQAETPEEERNALDKLEDEVEQLRDAVERDVDEGREKAHELLDDLESRITALRD
jgi:hypothetical protein